MVRRRGGVKASISDFQLDSRKIGGLVVQVYFGLCISHLLCCFLRQETLLHVVSLHPGVLYRYWRHNSGDNPVMDQHPIQGE